VTGPTVLSPWYVVYRFTGPATGIEYYRSPLEEETNLFVTQRGLAMLFTNLNSAARVAASEGAEIRVLVSKENAEEFGR
jgi:hypothetical protein